MSRSTGRHRGWHIAVALALLALSLTSMGSLTLAPSGDEAAPVAVVFPIWWDAERSFRAAAQAGGVVVREGGIASLLVAQSSEPEFRRRLHAAGAWLLLDPKAIAACLK